MRLQKNMHQVLGSQKEIEKTDEFYSAEDTEAYVMSLVINRLQLDFSIRTVTLGTRGYRNVCHRPIYSVSNINSIQATAKCSFEIVISYIFCYRTFCLFRATG